MADKIPASLTPDMVPLLRQGAAGMGRPSDEDLRRGRAFDIEDRTVPGLAGEPDISVLICRPRYATARLAAVYHIHGGGMVMGDNRLFVAEALDWAEVRAWCGQPDMPRSWALTRTAH
jgi:acetyl esterase/lipase